MAEYKVKQTIPEQLLDLGLRQVNIFPEYNADTGNWVWKVSVVLANGIRNTINIGQFWNDAILDGSAPKRAVIKGFIDLCVKECLGVGDADVSGDLFD